MKKLMLAVIAACLLVVAPAGAHLTGCHDHRCDVRVGHRIAKVARPYWGDFNAIAGCESHHHWHINTHNGYYGGIQFSKRSWRSVGGRGLPSATSRLEQIYRGVRLMRMQGWNAWPVCRRAAGR